MELVEGPHEERLASEMRVRGVACHEDSVGWLHVSNKNGPLAELSTNVYKTTEAIGMTDIADFSNCKLVRRVEAAEALELLTDEAEVTPSEGGVRRKFRACKDGREGWVTVSGSQGTVYVRPVHRHYIVKKATPVHSGLSAESPVVRVLMPGEAFAAFEEPKEVSGGECLTLYKVRCMKDAAEGWVTSTMQQEVQRWTSKCKVLRSSPLTSTFAANEAAEPVEVTRLLEPGEIVETTEQPAEDKSTGQLRVRCIAIRDQAIGWATVRESGPGAVLLLQPASQEEATAASEQAAPSSPTGAENGRGSKRNRDVKEEDDEDARPGKKGKGKGKGKHKNRGQ